MGLVEFARKFKGSICLSILWTIMGCAPPVSELSEIPQISLETVTVLQALSGEDSVVVIEVKYQDGDGNIGLTEGDSLPPFNFGSPYFHNLPVSWYEPHGDDWKLIINPQTNRPVGNYHERIPPLGGSKEKAISGKITFHVIKDPEFLGLDTVQLRMRLIDKKLNESNEVTTPQIVLK